MADRFLAALNVKKRCNAAGVGLWQCPHFLFPVMGFIVIISIVATYLVTSRVAEPEITALIVLAVAAVLFVIGTVIVRSFENVVEAARLKSEFVSIVSHELRSPLSAIRWSMELLQTGTSKIPMTPDMNSACETITEQTRKMGRLINTLIEVRKVEDETLELQPEAFSLKAVTEEALANLLSFARASNVEIQLEAPASLPDVRADLKKIQLVIENLIDNAIRYGGGGEPVRIRIWVDGKRVLWSIEDRGAGISKEDVQNIFQMFYRAHNVYRYRAGGLGVGLYLSRAIVEASGGEMHFESKEGQGSTFWFSLSINNH
ncbi:MAG: HAMP domain-containing histidine kinase [Candidatus Niyogibacteria bacterium]|nr:HAMP domain-containing histidine kinase [Candidatus Niyogibacteria bacterium]